MSQEGKNYTYILRCKDNTFYTGWTNHLEKRLKMHNEGKGAKYTKVRRPVELIYYETFSTKEEAMRREWEIKQLTRKKKEELIEKNKRERKETMMEKEELQIRSCTWEDLDAVMELQKKISAGIKQKEWFAETSREDNEKFFKAPNLVLGVYAGERMVAYGSIGFLEEDKENLGWELNWTEEKVKKCANLDTIVVDADFRGRGLQQTLIKECVEYARKIKPGGTVLTTICPENIYSLRNAQKEGFQVLLQKKMYGGKNRYILGKE